MAPDDADTRRLKDFAGTVVLLLVQAAGWRAALFLTPGHVPVLLYGGFALLMLTVVVSVWRVARSRSAAWLAFAGCVMQLALGGVALLLI